MTTAGQSTGGHFYPIRLLNQPNEEYETTQRQRQPFTHKKVRCYKILQQISFKQIQDIFSCFKITFTLKTSIAKLFSSIQHQRVILLENNNLLLLVFNI